MSRSKKNTEPAVSDVKVTPEKGRIIPESEKKSLEPQNIEVETPNEEPVPAPEASPVEKIQTDVRAKLAKKSDKEDVFVPTNPAALEKAAEQVAKESNFELNRGTSIGARLMARSRKLA